MKSGEQLRELQEERLESQTEAGRARVRRRDAARAEAAAGAEQLRALKLPLLAGDYARFERRLGAEIRDVSVLNEGPR